MSYIKLSKNHVLHDKSKHVEIKYHFIQDKIQGAVSLLIQEDSDPHRLLQVSKLAMLSFIYTGGPRATSPYSSVPYKTKPYSTDHLLLHGATLKKGH
jgi:hypothetical protein